MRESLQLVLQSKEDSSHNRIKDLVNEELKQYFRCGTVAASSVPLQSVG